jgi:hypothetical protein
LNVDYHEGYKESILEFQKKTKGLRLGYVPGVIRHFFHGSKKNRKYTERWNILIQHAFTPLTHVKYDTKGILVPTEEFPSDFENDILNYFKERNEDE